MRLLSPAERDELSDQMALLQAIDRKRDVDAIRQQTDALGRRSEAFRHARMDKSIREALAGVSLDALDEEADAMTQDSCITQ